MTIHQAHVMSWSCVFICRSSLRKCPELNSTTTSSERKVHHLTTSAAGASVSSVCVISCWTSLTYINCAIFFCWLRSYFFFFPASWNFSAPHIKTLETNNRSENRRRTKKKQQQHTHTQTYTQLSKAQSNTSFEKALGPRFQSLQGHHYSVRWDQFSFCSNNLGVN